MDNIYNAMISLFVVSTMEGWPDTMYFYIDGSEDGPVRNN